MNKEEFIKHVNTSEGKTLALDFDGVIHNDTKGFYDGTIYGAPIKGTKDALVELSKSFKLVIYSCKSNPKRPLIKGKTGTELIWEWLEQWDMKQFISDVVVNKPNALIYIDDKGLKFESWNQTIKQINE
jgi:hypothetical protein|tara:strand:- start:1304 stop:1690 length:387 start_codon:yes stop_codon:yes gene_type:complete